MFQETKEGKTHFENDGCGEPAHNKRECMRNIERNYSHEQVIKLISEAVEEETLRWTYMTSNEREHEAERILSSIQNNAIK